jgi:putative addiction module component (TIGR02574 family)
VADLYPRERSVVKLTSEEIVDAALALPVEERAVIVERLLESISPDEEATSEEELAAELDRRRAESLQSGDLGIPWDELKRQE